MAARGNGDGGGNDGSRGLSSLDPAMEAHLHAAAKRAADSDFKRYVLYLQDGVLGSNKALDLMNANPLLKAATYLQDKDLLRLVPPWLNGTPIMVDKETGFAYRGTKCLEFIYTYNAHEKGAVGVMGRRMGKGKRAAFEYAMTTSNNWLASASSIDVTNTPGATTHGRLGTALRAAEDSRITERDIADYTRRREAVTQSAQQWQQSSNGQMSGGGGGGRRR